MRKAWLLIIILFSQATCEMDTSSKKDSIKKSGYLFIKSCIHPGSGLARRFEGERFTTPYANALAAMALIHEKDLDDAEKIFGPFQHYYQLNRDHFNGLPQTWNVETGLPDSTSVHWEGDAAFLAIALNYYQHFSEKKWHFQPLFNALIKWLLNRAGCANVIVAEGIAEMAAALTPFQDDGAVQEKLAQLRKCFFSEGQICSRDYQHNLSHIIRGAMVFNDSTGFQYAKNFARFEIWERDGSSQITAYRAFTEDPFINIEISTQLLLALKITHQEAKILSDFQLASEIEKLKSSSPQKPTLVGIPLFVSIRSGAKSGMLPALEPTCYLLFYFWRFNPFLPIQ